MQDKSSIPAPVAKTFSIREMTPYGAWQYERAGGYLDTFTDYLARELGLKSKPRLRWFGEGENLTLEYADESLSRYKVSYQPDRKHLRNIAEPQLFDTPHHSLQPLLWELGDGDWLKVIRLPGYSPRRKTQTAAEQAGFDPGWVRTGDD